MLINYVPGEECRIAITQDGRLEEFYQERASTESHVGNIYKGRVMNVEPSIQAAFVDFGLERNGFLHISDLHPMYFPGKDREEFEQVGSKTPHRERPPIQRCLKRGQEVLVQVLKEGIGTKGPTLTSYLSIPGRFIVMMPNMQRLGVSRKVDDDDARRASRQLLAELNPPEGFGFIIRTAGIGQTKTDLKRDLAYLQRLWKNIERRRKQIGRVGELYTESDLVIRTIRDVFSNEIDRIIVDDPTAARRAHDFLTIASPRSRSKVVYYNDPVPLYHRFDIERQIDSIHAREVPLPSGGSLVIDQTEALVAIDVNSGKSRDARDAETNAFNTDKEAVDEICRQLRLRDLGGVVVLDLIDMRDPKHRRTIESRIRQNLKKDRARTRIGAISQFGLLEMTRQRMRPSLKTSIYTGCDHCQGFGHVKSPESVVLDVMRRLALAMQHGKVTRIELTISPDVAFQLLNRKRAELVKLETRLNKPVMVRVGGSSVDFVNIAAFDERGPVDIENITDLRNLPAESADSFVELEGGELPEGYEEEEEDLDLDEAPRPDLEELQAGHDSLAAPPPGQETATADEAQGEGRGKRRRRRRGGRGRRKKTGDDAQAQPQAEQKAEQAASNGDGAAQPSQDQDGSSSDDEQGQGKRRRRRRRRGGRGRRRKQEAGDEQASQPGEASEVEPNDSGDGSGGGAGGDAGGGGGGEGNPNGSAQAEADRGEDKKPKKPAPKRAPRREPKGEAKSEAKSEPAPRASSGYANRVLDTKPAPKPEAKPDAKPQADEPATEPVAPREDDASQA